MRWWIVFLSILALACDDGSTDEVAPLDDSAVFTEDAGGEDLRDAAVDAEPPAEDVGAEAPDEGAVEPDSSMPVDEVVGFLQPYVDEGWFQSVSGALVRGEEVAFFGLGTLYEGADRAPTPDTIYEVGSITKAFTALMLAQRVEAAALSLDQPVVSLLPEGLSMPTHDDLEITLHHLANHHSGLPRIADNMPFGDPDDPYIDFTVELLYAFLDAHELARAPGAAFGYSNLGYALLGHVLGLEAELSYEALLAERITEPLGLPDTVVTLDDERWARTALPHDEDRRPTMNWSFGELPGLGGIRSTARDLARLVQHLLDPPEGFAGPMALTMDTVTPLGGEIDIGLAWFIRDEVVGHGGATGGYVAQMSFVPEADVGVVFLINSSAWLVDTDLLARVALNALLARDGPPPPTPRPTEAVPDEVLQSWAGTYRNVLSGFMEVVADEGRVFARLNDQDDWGCYPVEPLRCAARVIPGLELSFAEDGAFLVLHQRGNNRFDRVDE